MIPSMGINEEHTTATVDLQEIQRAKKFIESYGYETCLNSRGHIVVHDPVYQSGFGAQCGQLIRVGVREVTVRNYNEAVRFIDCR
jgi:hypothetical protein